MSDFESGFGGTKRWDVRDGGEAERCVSLYLLALCRMAC